MILSRSVTKKTLGLATLSIGISLSAFADDEPDLFTFYGKIYPEWKVQSFGNPSLAGTKVGTMGTLKNDRLTLSKDASGKLNTDDHAWSNSYIGFRGQIGDEHVRLGYDLQVTSDPQGESHTMENLRENRETRDAFIYATFPMVGQIAIGKMDSIYKEWGDRGRMFGITSGNFISTSKLISGVGWKAEGGTSFHNRRSHTIGWFSPSYQGWEAGVTHSHDETSKGPGGPGTRLTSAAIRWRDKQWYAALATERHHNWLPLSYGATPAADSILNQASTTSSKDQAWRLSGAWTNKQWKLSSDIAHLRYSEDDKLKLPGKFRSYQNVSWQTAAEYQWNDALRLAASHVRSNRGSCALSGNVACTTSGLGGHQTALGAFYALNRTTGLFLLGAHTHNGPGSRYGSAAQGGKVVTYALGVKVEFEE